jgi:hypothetical protein
MEGSLRNISRSMAITAYRNGGGARGRGDGAWTVASTTIVLAVPADATNFEVGMFLQFSDTDGTSGTVRTGQVRITAINRLTGVITVNTAVSGAVAGVVNTDFIFRSGDFATVSNMASGLQAWLPMTAPTAGDNFYGVDRSADTMRLAGITFAGGGGNKEETLIDAIALGSREGADFDQCMCNPLDRADIVKSLGTKAQYEPVKSTDGVIGYKALIVEGEDGPVKVLSDISCPKGSFFIQQNDTWVKKSAKPAPRYLKEDGPEFLRETSADGYEWRIGAYWNIGCEAPGFNCAGTW